jgi:hypothetical protein
MVPRVLRVFSMIALVGASFGLCGCRGGNTVSGTVTYKGKTLNSGTVIFYVGDKTVPAPISSDGTYLATGVPVGSAKVTVAVTDTSNLVPSQMKGGPKGQAEHAPLPGGDSGPAAPPVPIPAKYAAKESSDLSYEIHSGKNAFDIDLK